MITANVADGGSTTSATGGIIYSQLGNLSIKNCKFMNNSSVNFEYGGGLIFVGNGSLFIKDCVFSKNKVSATTFIEGGILRVDGCTTNMADVVIKNNTISITNDLFTTYNGAILKATSLNEYNLTNVLISKNFIKRSADVYIFGGIAYIYVPATLMNVTIANNKIENENSVVFGKTISAYEEVAITNSILWNPGALAANEIDGNPVVTYSDVRGSFNGTGNINADPLFVSPKDFHLQPSSPCANAGTIVGAPPVDLDGNIRPAPTGTHPDMGCYEVKQDLQEERLEENPATRAMKVYPNPSSGTMNLSYISIHEARIQVMITDLSGKMLWKLNTTVVAGSNVLPLDLSSLVNGTYFIHVMDSGQSLMEKVMISK
jgi:hypothetical protein